MVKWIEHPYFSIGEAWSTNDIAYTSDCLIKRNEVLDPQSDKHWVHGDEAVGGIQSVSIYLLRWTEEPIKLGQKKALNLTLVNPNCR